MFDANASTVDGYDSFASVLREVRDVYVDDLVRYTSRLHQGALNRLQPAPRGIYVRGMLEPIVNFDDPAKRYYTESQFRTNKLMPNISNFDEFVASKELVVDERGKVICTIPCMIRSYFHPTCDFHYSAIHLAVAEVWQVLNSLTRDIHVCSTIPSAHLDQRYWLLNTNEEVGSPDISSLTDSVYNFIGRDFMHVYSLRVTNTTLYVEKGNDFRVIQYYRQIFERLESERFEQFGY